MSDMNSGADRTADEGPPDPGSVAAWHVDRIEGDVEDRAGRIARLEASVAHMDDQIAQITACMYGYAAAAHAVLLQVGGGLDMERACTVALGSVPPGPHRALGEAIVRNLFEREAAGPADLSSRREAPRLSVILGGKGIAASAP